MKLDPADIETLRPLIDAAVAATLDRLDADRARLTERLGYPEAVAAELIGVARHVLRDCRLRGEIRARKVGARYVYSRSALLRFISEGE